MEENNGKHIENRAIGQFSKIIVKAAGSFEIHQGESEQLLISGNKENLSRIFTEVQDHTLIISYNADWLDWLGISLFSPEAIHVSITTPFLEELSLHSLSHLSMHGLTAERLTLALDGPGSIKLSQISLGHLQAALSGIGLIEVSGQTQTQAVLLNGAGTYRAAHLESQQTEIRLAGVGNAHLAVQKQLDVTLTGAGNIEYFGAPQVTQKITGLGMLKPSGMPSIQ